MDANGSGQEYCTNLQFFIDHNKSMNKKMFMLLLHSPNALRLAHCFHSLLIFQLYANISFIVNYKLH